MHGKTQNIILHWPIFNEMKQFGHKMDNYTFDTDSTCEQQALLQALLGVGHTPIFHKWGLAILLCWDDQIVEPPSWIIWQVKSEERKKFNILWLQECSALVPCPAPHTQSSFVLSNRFCSPNVTVQWFQLSLFYYQYTNKLGTCM